MNKIILATVLLVALSAFAQTTRADEATFEKCFEDKLDKQVKMEIPTELRLAREHFDSLGVVKASHDQLQEYKETLNMERLDNLLKAADKYIDETMASIVDDPCFNMNGYSEWSAIREQKDAATKEKLFGFKNLAIRLIAFY